MKAYRFLLALVLTAIIDGAFAVGQPAAALSIGDSRSKALSSLEAGASAAKQLALVRDVLGERLVVSCDKCRSGFALKVVEQAMQKKSTVESEQLAEVERLRTQGEALYNEGKFKESLQLLQQAEAILGIDASGDPIPPTKQTSGAGDNANR